MRADQAVRHNAAVGALLGFGVGDALRATAKRPALVGGGDVVPLAWGRAADRCFGAAEGHLRGHLLDMDVGAGDVVGVAIALADPDATPPLLIDPDAILMCDLVRSGLSGRLDLQSAADTGGSAVTRAAQAVHDAATFPAAFESADTDLFDLVGALAGLRWGPAGIPAAWATGLHGPVGDRTYGTRQLRRLAERLLGFDAPAPPEPRRSLGPTRVAPGLWLSNLHAVPRFVADQPEGAVISLCPTTGAFDGHPFRREFALHDAAGSTVNPHLSKTVDEVLATIAAFQAEGRDVLVHCHHGASRTGLILRAWLMTELGLSEEDATTEAQVRWPKTSTWNRSFVAELQRRGSVAPDHIERSGG